MYSGAVIAGRYRLDALVGAGAMGQVWRAHDERLAREVAVKVVDLTNATGGVTRERFQREVLATARLHHPNVVTTYDGGTEGDLAYMVMELASGEPLSARLRRGPLSIDEVTRVGMSVAAALQAAHAIGLVHRDIKPANVMVDDRAIKVLDFGIAQLAEEASQLTGVNETVGTAAYMSPEQAAGQRVGPASDLYSLGCLLFALLAGRAPFTGPSAVDVARQQISAAPPRVSTLRHDVPPALDALVASLLAKRPQDRPDPAGVLQALRSPAPSWPDADRTVVMPPQAAQRTAVMDAQSAPAASRPASPPPTARRFDNGGADARLGLGAPPAPAGGRWFRRTAKWLVAAMVGLVLLGLLGVLGPRLVTGLTNSLPTPGRPTAQSPKQPTGGGGVQLPSLPTIGLPTIQLPHLPSGQDAALAGVSATLGAWSPATDEEAKAKEKLASRWQSTADKIKAGKKPKTALSDFRSSVEEQAAEGHVPLGTKTALDVALQAVGASL